MTFEDSLKRMYERDTQDIKLTLDQLDKIYSNLPKIVQETSDLIGISQEELMRIAHFTVFNHANLKVYEVINILHSFFIHRKRLLEETNK